jgi:hypothetical protein
MVEGKGWNVEGAGSNVTLLELPHYEKQKPEARMKRLRNCLKSPEGAQCKSLGQRPRT